LNNFQDQNGSSFSHESRVIKARAGMVFFIEKPACSMSRKSGSRFSGNDMRQTKTMSRKSGNRFSGNDMRKSKQIERAQRIEPNATRSKCGFYATQAGCCPLISEFLIASWLCRG
jgi:hypothetical protein